MIKLKHILPIIASVALVSCGMFKPSAPEKFVGTITYAMSYSAPEGEENAMLDAMAGMLPTELVQGTDGVDFGMTLDGNQSMHLVAKMEENMYYISAQGQFMKQAITEPDTTEETPDITIEELEEEREYLGYKCKGFKVTNGENSTTVFITEKFHLQQPEEMVIGGSTAVLEMISGTPLYTESTVNQGGQTMVIKLEAKSIVEGAEAAKDLVTPDEGEYMEM